MIHVGGWEKKNMERPARQQWKESDVTGLIRRHRESNAGFAVAFFFFIPDVGGGGGLPF